MSIPTQTRDQIHVSEKDGRIILRFANTCPRARINDYGEMLDGITGLGASTLDGKVLTCTVSSRNTTPRERLSISRHVRTRLENGGVEIVPNLSDLAHDRPVH